MPKSSAILVACCLILLLDVSAVLGQKKPPRAGSRWELMDYGPFLTASIQAPAPKKNNAMKGVVVPLGFGNAAICFDTDLLRYSAGWVRSGEAATADQPERMADFLHLRGTPFDGGHGNWPAVKGDLMFSTSPMPGWGKPGSADFADPRAEPFGPLPLSWARYQGLYRHGRQVVFSYTVGNCKVLERPGAQTDDGITVFTRTFNLGPSTHALTLQVAEVDKAAGQVADGIAMLEETNNPLLAGLIHAPAGVVLQVAEGKVLLKLPPLTKPVAFQLALSRPGKDNQAQFKTLLGRPSESFDLAPLTRGGPPLWTETVTTRGTLGTGNGGYVVDTVTTPEENPYRSWMRFGGFDFFSDGRAALCTWSGDVWIVSGIDAKLDKLVWKRFAAGLFQPLGLKIVDDKVYTLGREGIVRLHDLNGDGEADFYEAFNNEVHTTTGFHEFAFDLQTDPEGNFYFAKAGPVRGGGRGFEYIAAHSGCLLKVSKDGSKMEVFASGLRAPNGIGVGPKGEVSSGDNEGTWMPMCRLSLARPGGFLGCLDTYHGSTKPADYDRPLCWMPKNVDNSSGGQCWVTSDRWGPLQGQLLHTAYGTSSLYVAPFERDGDEVQGGVVRMPVNFLTGVMRPRFSPHDGQLYVCGLRGWQTNAARDAAFQRVRYTGKPLHLVNGIKVLKDGIELTFTDPLDAKSAAELDNYSVQQWNYLWCSEYGSTNYSAKDPDFHKKVVEYNRLREDRGKNREAIAALARDFKPGKDTVKVSAVQVSADCKKIMLDIADLKPVMQMHVRFRLKAADGSPVSSEVYNTINHVPK